jgi:hypothetical protein
MQTINQFDFMEIDQQANWFGSGVLKRGDADSAEKRSTGVKFGLRVSVIDGIPFR